MIIIIVDCVALYNLNAMDFRFINYYLFSDRDTRIPRRSIILF